MQLGGIGGEHNAAMHQVTHCGHSHSQRQGDIAGGLASSAADVAAQLQQAELKQEAQFSLSAWMDRAFGKGKRMLQNFWGGTDTVNFGEAGEKTGNPQVMAQSYGEDGANAFGREGRKEGDGQPEEANVPLTSQIAAAATGVINQTAHENLPFATVEEFDKAQETIWQKMRVKVKDVAGQLSGHLPGKFLNFQTGGFFQAKQQQTKEEPRKTVKPGRDRVEIHCAQVEDSYLLDSYDKNGSYSKLSTRK